MFYCHISYLFFLRPSLARGWLILIPVCEWKFQWPGICRREEGNQLGKQEASICFGDKMKSQELGREGNSSQFLTKPPHLPNILGGAVEQKRWKAILKISFESVMKLPIQFQLPVRQMLLHGGGKLTGKPNDTAVHETH